MVCGGCDIDMNFESRYIKPVPSYRQKERLKKEKIAHFRCSDPYFASLNIIFLETLIMSQVSSQSYCKLPNPTICRPLKDKFYTLDNSDLMLMTTSHNRCFE